MSRSRATDFDDVLWIGGAQWAGKSSVTTLLAARHPVATYRYDYHDARSHSARALVDRARFPVLSRFVQTIQTDPDGAWVRPTPQEMAATARAIFIERFELAREDLDRLPDGLTVIAEGWGFRPELIAPLLSSPERAVFLVPTEEFRESQQRGLARARSLSLQNLSDPARAQRNRLARDAILARDVVVAAHARGMRVIEVDGSIDESAVTQLVEEQFRPFLPRWLY